MSALPKCQHGRLRHLTSAQLFYLSEKMLSFGKDDFTIKDINGHTVFKVDASLLSMKGARALTDAARHTILTMQHKVGPFSACCSASYHIHNVHELWRWFEQGNEQLSCDSGQCLMAEAVPSL